jgi:HEAT repeat protein
MLLDHRRIEFNDYEDLYVETAMRELGPVVVSEVERQALSSDLSQVSNACEAMRCLGAEFYAQVQPVLAQMLESKENDHHWGALYALEKMGPAAQDLLPLVKPNLTHSDFQLQIIALRALAGIGPPAMVHEEIVRDLTTNGQNVSVKSHALRALGYIAAGEPKQAEAAAEVIGKNLKEFAFATKSRALEGLIQLQANAAPTAGVIKELLHDQTGLAPQAAVVHGYITGEWDTTIKLLVSLIKDPVVGMECLDLLRKLGPKAVAAETAIRDMTGNEDETVAWLAVDALAALVNVQDKSALEQLDTDQRQRLDRIAAHLQKFSTEGEIEPHHRAGVLVAQWQGIGWQPKEKAPAPAAEQTPASVPAARE